MSGINRLWNDAPEKEWLEAVKTYDNFIKSSKIAELDAEIDPIDLKDLGRLNDEHWFQFLYEKYFPWKYTAYNRLATTRKYLVKHRDRIGGLEDLGRIRDRLLDAPVEDIRKCLELAKLIGGLGTAGASGLLALMYPQQFGTVDEFLILALSKIDSLPEYQKLLELSRKIEKRKNSGGQFQISVAVGTILIKIMQRKAFINNQTFSSSFWTPRQIDKVLWAYGH